MLTAETQEKCVAPEVRNTTRRTRSCRKIAFHSSLKNSWYTSAMRTWRFQTLVDHNALDGFLWYCGVDSVIKQRETSQAVCDLSVCNLVKKECPPASIFDAFLKQNQERIYTKHDTLARKMQEKTSQQQLKLDHETPLNIIQLAIKCSVHIHGRCS